jgi:hypothetical protein
VLRLVNPNGQTATLKWSPTSTLLAQFHAMEESPWQDLRVAIRSIRRVRRGGPGTSSFVPSTSGMPAP